MRCSFDFILQSIATASTKPTNTRGVGLGQFGVMRQDVYFELCCLLCGLGSKHAALVTAVWPLFYQHYSIFL